MSDFSNFPISEEAFAEFHDLNELIEVHILATRRIFVFTLGTVNCLGGCYIMIV